MYMFMLIHVHIQYMQSMIHVHVLKHLLYCMQEQQTLSIAKAGIICSLNARTSILAAANPRMSQWDEKLTVVENIQLPHTLLSRLDYQFLVLCIMYNVSFFRFDLIFLMLDPQDDQFDRRLATHLVSLYHQTKADEETLDMVYMYQILYVSVHTHTHVYMYIIHVLLQYLHVHMTCVLYNTCTIRSP